MIGWMLSIRPGAQEHTEAIFVCCHDGRWKNPPRDTGAGRAHLIGGFSPKIFQRITMGGPCGQGVDPLLNVPAVHELRDYRYEKFYQLLKKRGSPPSHSHRAIMGYLWYWAVRRERYGTLPGLCLHGTHAKQLF